MQTITSPRLQLRKPQLSDATALFATYTYDPEVARFTTWKAHTSVEETQNFMQFCIEKWDRDQEYHFILERNSDQKVIGMFSIKIEQNIAHVGYVFAKDEWHKGYATEAVRTAIEYLFTRSDVGEVQAFCDKENKASERVMIKSGMQLIKELPAFVVHPNISAEKRDCFLYGVKKGAGRS